jgi:hypothetical protein
VGSHTPTSPLHTYILWRSEKPAIFLERKIGSGTKWVIMKFKGEGTVILYK